jgi:MFS family permease
VAAGWTAGMLVFAWPWGRVKSDDDRRLVLLELALLGGIATVVLASATVPAPLWLLPIYLIGGGFNVGLNVLAGTVVARRAPAQVRGRVFGVFAAVSNGANMVGYLAGGLLVTAVAPRLIMLGTGVAGLLVSGAFVAGLLRPERVPKTTPAEVDAPAPAPVG